MRRGDATKPRTAAARRRPAAVLLAVVLGLGALPLVASDAVAATDPCGPSGTPVACENSLPGNPDSEWDVVAPDPSIEGFAAEQSVNVGGTISFKVRTNASSYTAKVYRLGYYGGAGARFITDLATTPRTQPACLSDVATGLYDCGNWQASASWTVPSATVSGVFVVVLRRPDTGAENHIAFVVRQDASTSALLFQTADTTWQAYNKYGGANLYPGGNGPQGRAYKVSYNRPTPTHGDNFLFSAEYPMLRFLERNGYDVTYTSGIDTDRRGNLLTRHRTFLSVGHDEYWSGPQRANVEAARNAGMNLAFFAGNDVYWKTRYENSIDGSATPYRTLVCYKETWDNAASDPAAGTWTGTWRDPRFSPPKDGGVPENALVGTAYVSNFTDLALQVPAEEGKLRIWRNTTVAALAPGQTATLAPHTIGYESNEDLDNGFRPAGLVRMSKTVGPTPEYLRDFGTVVTPGTTTHTITLYKHASGALVFSAGTIQWSWGLDETHDDSTAPADPAMRQATINLLADMDAQPATLMAGMVAATASTDTAGPTVAITSPAAGSTVANGTTVTLAGTASDAAGRVGGVEVSVDGGRRWHPATGRETWSYTFRATGSAATTWRVRASDDSANIGPEATSNATVNCPCTLFGSATPATPDGGDGADVELGLRFTPESDGFVAGVRFYKAAANTGAHVGTLWTAGGTVLAQGTFSGESASGWQTLEFASPVPVAANTTYVVSYRARNGHYSADVNALWSDVVAPPLLAPRSLPGAPNGVFGSGGSFPQNDFKATNYYVDALFSPSAVDTLPPSVSATTPADGSTGVVATTGVTVTFTERVDPQSIVFTLRDGAQATVAGSTEWNASTRTYRFTPGAALSRSTSYSASIRATDLAGNAMGAPVTWSFSTGGSDGCPCSIFSSSLPSRVDSGDTDATEVGLRFTAAGSGWVTGVRFHKALANTGTHTGTLWSATGTALASGTFVDETAAGWQTLEFDVPVQITAGTEYVVSHYAPNGHYSADNNALLNDLTVGPLTAPGGTNGVYKVAVGGGFPTSSFRSTNYWVDVLFTTTAPVDTRPPLVTQRVPASAASQVGLTSTVSAVFNEPVNEASIAATVTSAQGAVLPGTVSYTAATRTVRFTPAAPLAVGTTYTVALSAADVAGNTPAAPTTWTFTTRGACPCSLFPTQMPTTVDAGDASPTELGVRFRAVSDGFVVGVRFYKSAANVGVHTGSLWTTTGTRLATGTFDGETASGWQYLEFATPVTVTAGTTYVASYHAPNGRYSADQNYFTQDVGTEPLVAPAEVNGVFAVGAGGGYPSSSFRSSNYWVDPVFTTAAPADTSAPTVASFTPVSGAAGVSPGVAPTGSFSEPVQESSIRFTVTGPGDSSVPGRVTYDAATRVATFTPDAELAEGTQYTVSARATDLAGNAGPVRTWSFTTWSSAVCPCTLFNGKTPTTVDAGDGAATELGVRFSSSVSGFVTGIRFYKAAANTGVHTGTLWTTQGTALATGTFSAESAAGWQTMTFPNPVAITAGTTYVASYFAPNGRYAADQNYFTSAVDQVPLTAAATTNGVYAVGGGYPSTSFRSSNYWVDPIFARTATFDTTPPAVTTVVPAVAATSVSSATTVSGTFDEPVGSGSVSFSLTGPSGAVPATVAYDVSTRTAVLTPAAGLAGSTTYTASLTATDLVGNAMTAARVWTFTTADRAAPVVTGATAAGSGTAATVTWTTDEASTSVVDYGTSATALTSTATAPGSVTAHSVTLSGLLPNTRYYYRVRSTDPAGNSTTSPPSTAAPGQYVPTVTPFVTDTAADFATGTDSGTYRSARSGGEVVLNPTNGVQEFAGTGVPTNWTSTALAAGSSVTVAGGAAVVSGRYFRRTATVAPSKEVDVVATLRPVAGQFVGFSSGDFSSTQAQWAVFRTSATGVLQAESRSGAGGATTTNLTTVRLGVPHRFEIDWTSSSVVYAVDGVVVATHARAMAGSMAVAVRDSTVDASPIDVDSVWLSPYAASGTWTSAVIDAGAVVDWRALTPTATTPSGTTVTYQVRTGTTAVPGASWSAWTTVAAGADLPTTTRYLQYRVTLTSAATRNTTPTVGAVSVGFAVP